MALGYQRRTRFGIPPVNQNPRPPNEARGGNGDGVQPGGYEAPDTRTNGHQGPQQTYEPPGQQGNQQGNGGGGGGKQNRQPHPQIKGILRKMMNLTQQQTQKMGTPPDAVAGTQTLNAQTVGAQIAALHGNPANALAFSSFTPGPGQVDPRDANYWNNVSNLLFNTQSSIASNNLDQSRSDIDYAAQMSDQQRARQAQQRSLAEQAMRSGLSQSGWVNRQDSLDTAQALRDTEDAQTAQTRSTADRQAATSQAIQDYIAGERDQASSAVDRYATSEASQATTAPPLYSPADIQRLERLLKPHPKNKGKGGKGKGK